MRLSPKEIEKLMLHGAGFLAQKRLWRGIRLNYPEAVALIASQLLEFIREGESVAVLMDKGKSILGRSQVLPSVAEMVDEVQVEGTFPDGVKLVTVHYPICSDRGQWALYGSGLDGVTPPNKNAAALANPTLSDSAASPGEFILRSEPILLNADRTAMEMEITNLGDRPIQVGSHYPFIETNACLEFDRAKAADMRLDIPSGTAVRFEPGETKTVRLVPLAGERIVYGGNALVSGTLDGTNREAALTRARNAGFASKGEP
ncbi:MAG: urease subunit beta [Fibrobacterota bacterium]|nr:urease subunit beta [Fibrobacterota bacterium]